MSCGCLAVDVVQAALDPLTGRTLSFNHVPMAAWAGHLCDLVLLGAVTDQDGRAVALDGLAALDAHPLVADAWSRLQPRLPRTWGHLFGPQTVDINDVVRDAQAWLIDAGVWTRRRTLFGLRYTAVAHPPAPRVPSPPGSERDRTALMQALLGLAQVDIAAPTKVSVNSFDTLTGRALRTVLSSTSELLAWKAMNPQLPRAGL